MTCVVLLACLARACLTNSLPQEAAPGTNKEVTGYVTDASNPDQIILGGAVSVAVNSKTTYWIQSGKDRPRKASANDVVVGAEIRAILGKDGLATTVTIFRNP